MLENFFKAYGELFPREVEPVAKIETPIETFVNTKQSNIVVTETEEPVEVLEEDEGEE